MSATATAPQTTRTVKGERAGDGEQLQLVTFEVGQEEYAVDILAVQEINRMLQITRVPQSPPDVEGVINLRGRIIPVIDLRKRFGLEADGQRSADSRIIVVEVGGRVIGFIVDRVHEVLRISSSIVDPTPTMATGTDAEYIQGVGKLDDRLLILLDLDKLFCGKTLKQVDQALAAAKAN